jgi:hypothetical protein
MIGVSAMVSEVAAAVSSTSSGLLANGVLSGFTTVPSKCVGQDKKPRLVGWSPRVSVSTPIAHCGYRQCLQSGQVGLFPRSPTKSSWMVDPLLPPQITGSDRRQWGLELRNRRHALMNRA